MKRTLSLALLLTCLACGCRPGSEREQEYPAAYLSAPGSYRSTIFGRWLVEGVLQNTAETAAYKNTVLEINFYSDADALLGTKYERIAAYISPGDNKAFSFRTSGPAGTQKLSWSVYDASYVRP